MVNVLPRPSIALSVLVLVATACGPRATNAADASATGAGEGPGPGQGSGALVRGPAVRGKVQCGKSTKKVNPLIYGIAFDVTGHSDYNASGQWDVAPTGRRFGGNASTRYNWEEGHLFNHGSDWHFENNSSGGGEALYARFLREDDERKVASAVVIPTIGWVAKDATSASFPTDTHGNQEKTDPHRKAGSGKSKDGTLITPPPPTQTSRPAPPEFMGRWVKAIASQGKVSPRIYILDNEPALWNSSHRDVHPEPLGYDELLERTVAYAKAVRAADPKGKIAGPSAFGWPEYFFSAKDAAAGFQKKPDRLAHGDTELIPWYLKKLKEHEDQHHEVLLDLVDVHFYPQGEGIGVGKEGATDPKTNERRLRATRALWDPTYVDESWIGEPVRLLPRMHEWIDQNYPGRGIQIGEWSYGSEEHVTGGLAVAETLGRFADNGVTSAFYWTYPAPGSAAYWAFRAFRNFDGKGARFLDDLVPATSDAGLSIWASKDPASGKVVVIALNFDLKASKSLELTLDQCGAPKSVRGFVYAGGKTGLAPLAVEKDASHVKAGLLPAAIAVFEIATR